MPVRGEGLLEDGAEGPSQATNPTYNLHPNCVVEDV